MHRHWVQTPTAFTHIYIATVFHRKLVFTCQKFRHPLLEAYKLLEIVPVYKSDALRTLLQG